MTADTERQLHDYIELLKAKRDAAKERAQKARQEVANLRSQMEDDEYGWSNPRPWREDDLPLPRLELHWARIGKDKCGGDRCVYVLVHRDLLGHIVGTPLGQMTRRGRCGRFDDGTGQLIMPFRDGAHARHDALHLGLPLYITTCDGDAVRWEGTTVHDEGTQQVIRRGAQLASGELAADAGEETTTP